MIATGFSNTISTGVLVLGAVGVVATIVGVVYGVKWKTAYAVQVAVAAGVQRLLDLSEERAQILRDERDAMQAKYDKSTAAVNEANKTIARLEALPNLERVLELMSTTFIKFGDELKLLHRETDSRADKRSESAVSTILDAIAKA